MHGREVVRLREVFHEQFPVCAHGGLRAAREAKRVECNAVELCGKIVEPREKRRGFPRDGYEQEPAERLESHRAQRMSIARRSLEIGETRGVREATSKVVGPSVVGAAN